MDDKVFPIEVSLVKEVKTCRSCQWFWGGLPPYGPYPAFDWQEPYPEAIGKPPEQTMSSKPIRWSEVTSCGDQLVEPAVMRGCRKAPIMTIGINPNLTSYFPGSKGACWAYPFFSRDATYAYYYRHATVFQESVDTEFIREHLEPSSEIRAEKDGWLVDTERGSDHRWLELTIQYQGEREPQHMEMCWQPGERAVVLFDRAYHTEGAPQFRAGDVIAGKVALPEGDNVTAYANGTGYYQRFIPVLERFAKEVGSKVPTMGEDVCMHDMVACASPGWSSSYDIPRDTIARHCVDKHDYVLRQLMQSRPDVVVIVSTSSLAMFAKSIEAAGGSFDFEYADRDIYDLLRETTQRKRCLTLNRDGVSLHARVLLTPHFSYGANFKPQTRFSEDAWKAFVEEFPNDAKILSDEGRVQPVTYNGFVPLQIDGPDDPIQNKIGINAWEIVMARFYDPYSLLTGALVAMHDEGLLRFDVNGDHLERSAGTCCFCVNQDWQFPEGCPYGKV